jgi:mannose-6-phosphate isomerase
VNEKSTVKILNVKRNSTLSLQTHKNRREVWYFLTSGFAQIDGKIKRYSKGDTVEIKKGVEHRLFSKATPVRVLEIAFGKFDEKDEVRILDKYGRH